MLGLPEGLFDLIVADPPWTHDSWSKRGRQRAPSAHYKVQPLDWICDFPVPALAAKHTHLMLWITGPHMVRGDHIRVMDAWGFKPSSMGFVWLKQLQGTAQGRFFAPPITHRDFFMGLGHTTRQNAEFVVFGRKGRPRRNSRSVHQLIVEPRREHSRKPEQFYERAEAYVGPHARKLELFSRTERPGWVVWGDEVEKFNLDQAEAA